MVDLDVFGSRVDMFMCVWLGYEQLSGLLLGWVGNVRLAVGSGY